MEQYCGRYSVDLDGTAKILANAFTSRCEMKPGYEAAVQQYIAAFSQNEAILGAELTIQADRLWLRSLDGESSFHVTRLRSKEGKWEIDVDWNGLPHTFQIVEMGPDVIRLACVESSLSSYAWKRRSEN